MKNKIYNKIEKKILATDLIAPLNLSYHMLSLDFLSTHFLGTSSGSVYLNAPMVLSHVMIYELSASGSNSGYAKNPGRPGRVTLTSVEVKTEDSTR